MISIIIATWNGQKYISYCLDSVFNQNFQDFKILIIDNASTDNTVKIIKTNYQSQIASSKLKLIENKKNAGFSGGYNQGIRETIKDSEYILISNQDIILEKNFLEEAIKFLETHSGVGAVTGKLCHWDFEKNKKTAIIDSANGIKMFKNRRAIETGQGEEDQGQYSETKEVFGVTGACSIFNSQALKEIGIELENVIEYLDEDFFLYKEDVDLSWRLRLYGWSCFYLARAIAYHDRTVKGGKNLSDLGAILNRKNKSKTNNEFSYKNHLLMLVKNELPSNFVLHFPWIFFYEFKKFIFMSLFEFSTLKIALSQFFKQLPRILRKRKIIMSQRKVSAKEMRKWMK